MMLLSLFQHITEAVLTLFQVMQVKNFGRRGRTKYTHLVDQDTTARDDYYSQEGMKKPNRRLAGTEQQFNKPKKFNT